MQCEINNQGWSQRGAVELLRYFKYYAKLEIHFKGWVFYQHHYHCCNVFLIAPSFDEGVHRTMERI